jgi:hypothetical protein
MYKPTATIVTRFYGEQELKPMYKHASEAHEQPRRQQDAPFFGTSSPNTSAQTGITK